MSAALMLLCLFGTAAIVWSACFVGCNLAHAGAPVRVVPYYRYRNTVTSTRGLVAYWPLNDIDRSTMVAADAGPNGFDGAYTLGPVEAFSDALHSDASPGGFLLNQPNIVAGDTTSTTGDAAPANPCVYFNGGYVRVPWQAALGPPMPGQFTLEAWVVPNWTLEDAQAHQSFRAVVVSAAVADFAGFGLLATPENLWSVQIGNGSRFLDATTGHNQSIVQGSLYFLVVTYNGSTLTLWVNPADTTHMPDAATIASGYVPVTSPVPLYIGTGRPDSPTPLFPFNGWIQDVAFYNVALDNRTIAIHYANGLGMEMP